MPRTERHDFQPPASATPHSVPVGRYRPAPHSDGKPSAPRAHVREPGLTDIAGTGFLRTAHRTPGDGHNLTKIMFRELLTCASWSHVTRIFIHNIQDKYQ